MNAVEALWLHVEAFHGTCVSCNAGPGAKCRDYRGKNKATCVARLDSARQRITDHAPGRSISEDHQGESRDAQPGRGRARVAAAPARPSPTAAAPQQGFLFPPDCRT